MKKLFDHPDILIFGAAALIYLAGIFTRPLGGDEYLMAVMVRDFVRNGQLTMMYETPYPILPLHLTGKLFRLSGFEPWGLRLEGMTAVLLCGALIKYCGTRLCGRNAGSLAALLYLLSFGVHFNATGAYAGSLAASFYLGGIVLTVSSLHREKGFILSAAGGIVLSLAALSGMVYLPLLSLAGLALCNCRKIKVLAKLAISLVTFSLMLAVQYYWETLPELAHFTHPGKNLGLMLAGFLPGTVFLPLVFCCGGKLFREFRENAYLRDAAVLGIVICLWTVLSDSSKLPFYAVSALFIAAAHRKLYPDIPAFMNVLFKAFPPLVITLVIGTALICRKCGIRLYRDGLQEFSVFLVIILGVLLLRLAACFGWEHPGKKIFCLAAFSLALMFNFPVLIPQHLLVRHSPHRFFRQVYLDCGSPVFSRILADRSCRSAVIWALNQRAGVLTEDKNQLLSDKKTTLLFLDSPEDLKNLPPGVIFGNGQWRIVYYP